MGGPKEEIQRVSEVVATEEWEGAPDLDVCLLADYRGTRGKQPEPIDRDGMAAEYLGKILDIDPQIVFWALRKVTEAKSSGGTFQRIAVRRKKVGDRKENATDAILRVQRTLLDKNHYRLPWEIIPLLLTLPGAMAARDQLGALLTSRDGVSVREYSEKMYFFGRRPREINPLWKSDTKMWSGPPLTVRTMLDIAANDNWFVATTALTGGMPKSCWDVGKTLLFPQNGRKMGLFWYHLADIKNAAVAAELKIEEVSLRSNSKSKTTAANSRQP